MKTVSDVDSIVAITRWKYFSTITLAIAGLPALVLSNQGPCRYIKLCNADGTVKLTPLSDRGATTPTAEDFYLHMGQPECVQFSNIVTGGTAVEATTSVMVGW